MVAIRSRQTIGFKHPKSYTSLAGVKTYYGPYRGVNYSELVLSQGHPYFSLLGRKIKHRAIYVKVPVFTIKKPKPRKPYLGKHPRPYTPRHKKLVHVHYKRVKVNVDYRNVDKFIQHVNADKMGGPFQVQHARYDRETAHVHSELNNPPFNNVFDGNIAAWSVGDKVMSHSDLIFPSSNATLDAYGATGIAKTIPTRTQSSIGQLMAEIHKPIISYRKGDTWRDIVADVKNNPFKKGGEHYLAYQYGFLPTVKDMMDLLKVTKSVSKRVKQLDRDSGRIVRRRKTLVDTSTTVVTDLGTSGGFPALTTGYYKTLGRLRKTVTTTQKVWFSGAFTYYIPPVSDNFYEEAVRLEALAHALYGVRADAQLVWELAPWSWMADWFSNAGDVYANLAAFDHDNLVMVYGYVMEHKTVTTTYSLTGLEFKNSDQTHPINVTDTITVECKARRKATPYGFGLDWQNFSAKQLGILAALGMTLGS